MTNEKGTDKSKFVFEDNSEFKPKSQDVKESPKAAKPQKRKKSSAPAIQEEQMTKLMGVNNKIRKISESQSVDTPQRVQDTFMKQIESRQQCTDPKLNNLSNILTELDVDYAMMKDNQEKFEQLTEVMLKCIQQSNVAQEQMLESLREMHTTFKKGCVELYSIQKEQNE